ncbi:MAG: hypothetical protein OK422_06495 [Thaumarchaeota archaeon]|nr:hypothetical protein [Nitrososphaerota archaeon]
MGLPSTARRSLILLIVLLVSWDAYFPSPFGFETRPIASTSLIFGIPFFVALFLNILAIPVLWKRPRIGSVFGILTAALMVLGVALDQTGFVVPGQLPPAIISAFEAIDVILSALVIKSCYTTYRHAKGASTG